jgi:hypothetical protein
MKLFSLIILISTCFAMIPATEVCAGGTATATIEPSEFNITYTPGRALQGNTEFTPSVWHQDNPSGPFGTCEKHGRVNIRVNKLIYPYRLLTDTDWYWSSYYNIGMPDADRVYKGLCIFYPSDMKIWDYKFDPFPNSILSISEASNFCSRAENQGRKHVITKTVNVQIPNETGTVRIHSIDKAVTINLSCDCQPLSLSGSGSGVIYRTDNQKVKHNLLTIGAASAVAPITATLATGRTPTGMTMKLEADSSALYLEGIPETEGDYRFSALIKDACPLERSESRDFTVSVRCGTMKFATLQKLPDATLNKPYSVDIQTTCSRAYGNMRYELLGELPSGLVMNPSGQISGTPTEEKISYFYVSVTGQEKGVDKEIHQRFDLNVIREIPILPGLKDPKTDGKPEDALFNTPEIIGVPASCNPGDMLKVAYRGLPSQIGSKMGLFSENEAGSDPQLGRQAVTGSSGTLSFNAPAQPGRYLFKIFDRSGTIVVKSPVFTLIRKITADAAAETTASYSGPLAGPVASAGLKTAGNLQDRLPALSCADSLPIKGIQGYAIDNCVKRYDEARVLINPNPEAPENLRLEGEKTSVIYEWPPTAGTSPSIIQVKRYFSQEARRLGATVLADSPGYTAFELIRSGKKTYLSIDVYNDGQTINFMVIEPEAVEN